MKSHTLLFRFVLFSLIIAFLSSGLSVASSCILMQAKIRSQETKSQNIMIQTTVQSLNELFDAAAAFVNTASHRESFRQLCTASPYSLSFTRYAADYKKSVESTLHDLEGVSGILNFFPDGQALFLDVNGQNTGISLQADYGGLSWDSLDHTGISLVLPSDSGLSAPGLAIPYSTLVNNTPDSVFLFLLDKDYLASLSGSLFNYTLTDGRQASWVMTGNADIENREYTVIRQDLAFADWNITFNLPNTSFSPLRIWIIVLIFPYSALCGYICFILMRRKLQPLYDLQKMIDLQQEFSSSYITIKKQFSSVSLSHMLLIILSSITLLSAIFFSFLCYQANMDNIRHTVYEVYEDSFLMVCSNISREFQKYQELLQRVSVAPEIQSALSSTDTENLNEFFTESEGFISDLHNISLFSNNDEMLYSTAYVMNYLTDSSVAEDLYRARTDYGDRIWRYCANSSHSSGEFRIGMLVIGSNSGLPGTGSRLGTIWMDFGDETIRSFFNSLEKEDGYYCIYDENNTQLFCGTDTETAAVSSMLLEYSVPVNQWTIQLYMPASLISTELQTFWHYAFGILLFMNLCLLAFCTVLQRNLLRSVRRLAGSMGALETCPLQSGNAAAFWKTDEILSICISYNNMLDRLSQTMRQNLEMERKSRQFEINMLQAQINPHFLYNTLRTAQVLILRNPSDAIILIDKLIILFRFSARLSPAAVTLGDECRQCKAYLSIQALRFSGRITASYDIPESLMSAPVLRFSLQPLVENIFQHAKISSDGHIRIFACEKENIVCLSIQDNGAGMPDEMLEVWNKKLQEESEYDSHIGLLNVHQRTRLYFGSPYGITLKASPGHGLTVILQIPAVLPSGSGQL